MRIQKIRKRNQTEFKQIISHFQLLIIKKKWKKDQKEGNIQKETNRRGRSMKPRIPTSGF